MTVLKYKLNKVTLLIMLMLMGLIPSVVAQTENLELSKVAGSVLPDSIFYKIDLWYDNWKINRASGLEKEKLKLEVAEERLGEFEVMIDKKKTDKAAVAEVERNKMVNSINVSLLNDDDKNDIEILLMKHILVLQEIKEKAPEQALKGIDNAIENSNKVFDNIEKEISIEKRIKKEYIAIIAKVDLV